MPTDEQHEELLRLIAALTERVYKLEQIAGYRQVQPRTPQPTFVKPVITTPKTEVRPHPEDTLESRIGGQWLNRVGIIAMLFGVSYFLKYAFENQWVGPGGRVVIGLMAGLAVVFWSEHVRRTGYAIFSYSLKAAGIGVLYLSLWAASQLYHLIPITLAFIAMTSVTAATVALALWQNAQVIAAFAAVGAFITPLALSTGENNAASLFTYVAILDLGALVLSRYRPWIITLAGSYIGTLILYSTWHSRFYTPDQFMTAMLAVTVVFVLFALTPFADKRDRNSNVVVVLVLANAMIYFYEVWDLFEHAAATRDSAIAAVALGCLYFVAGDRLTNGSPLVTAHVHVAIGAAFLVIAVPIGLDAQWITIGWLVEAGALIEVSRRTNNELLKYLGAAALASGVLRLLVIDRFDVSRLLLNERMMVYAIAIGVITFVALRWPAAAAMLVVTINILALVALTREITDAFSGIVRDFAYSGLWMSYGAGLMFLGFWKKSGFLRWQALVLIGITVCKVFIYDTAWLDRGYRILSFIALGIILLVTSFLYQRNWFKLEQK